MAMTSKRTWYSNSLWFRHANAIIVALNFEWQRTRLCAARDGVGSMAQGRRASPTTTASGRLNLKREARMKLATAKPTERIEPLCSQRLKSCVLTNSGVFGVSIFILSAGLRPARECQRTAFQSTEHQRSRTRMTGRATNTYLTRNARKPLLELR
jgi:hypothetical protein